MSSLRAAEEFPCGEGFISLLESVAGALADVTGLSASLLCAEDENDRANREQQISATTLGWIAFIVLGSPAEYKIRRSTGLLALTYPSRSYIQQASPER